MSLELFSIAANVLQAAERSSTVSRLQTQITNLSGKVVYWRDIAANLQELLQREQTRAAQLDQTLAETRAQAQRASLLQRQEVARLNTEAAASVRTSAVEQTRLAGQVAALTTERDRLLTRIAELEAINQPPAPAGDR